MSAAVGDIMEVVFQGLLHSQQVRNVRHYRLAGISGGSGASDSQSATSLATAMETFWNGLSNLLSNEFKMKGIVVQRVKPTPRTAGVLRVPALENNLTVSDSLPATNAVVTRLRTDFAGRKFRGRNFWCGIPKASEENSKINGGALTAWDLLADNLALTLVEPSVVPFSFTFVPIIFHKSDGTYTDVTSATADDVLRVQRRREVGKGI